VILVATGTNGGSFDRLLVAVAHLQTDEDLVIQHGPSSIRRVGATHLPSLPFPKYVELVARARVVVTHAGVGSILVSLMGGVRPILVPRLARFGEAVDDHQLELAQRLERLGRADAVIDVATLEEAVRLAPERPLVPPHRCQSTLVRELTGFLHESVLTS
jgi:UDP-N-acetylglucosamine transferase subunit ALG13